MKKLLFPTIVVVVCIVLNRATIQVAPYLIGIETLQEQVNGSMPVGMIYITGLETLATIFNILTFFSLAWLISKIILLIKERAPKNEKL